MTFADILYERVEADGVEDVARAISRKYPVLYNVILHDIKLQKRRKNIPQDLALEIYNSMGSAYALFVDMTVLSDEQIQRVARDFFDYLRWEPLSKEMEDTLDALESPVSRIGRKY